MVLFFLIFAKTFLSQIKCESLHFLSFNMLNEWGILKRAHNVQMRIVCNQKERGRINMEQKGDYMMLNMHIKNIFFMLI